MENIIKIYEQAEKAILEDAGKKIGANKELADVDIGAWEIDKLSRLGDLNDAQMEILAEASGFAEEELRKWIIDTTNLEIANSLGELKQLFMIPELKTDLLWRDIANLESETLKTIEMMTMAISNNVKQEYVKAVTEVSREMMINNISVDDALYRVANEWGDFGLAHLTDKAGRRWRPETYLRMVAKANHKRVMTTVKERGYDDNDVDLVYVTELADSRPSHMEFQGNIYSRSGKHPDYPSLDVTGYGEIDGIETGINCRHRLMPYVEGMTIKRVEPLSEQEMEEVEEAYEESQKQRYYERQIRDAKRRLKSAESMGLSDEKIKRSQDLLKNRQRAMNNWIKNTDRKRNYKRERV